MTGDELAAIQARVDAAPPGPWRAENVLGRYLIEGDAETVGEGFTERAATFIAHAREDIPTLLAEVKRLQAERAELAQVAVEVARLDSDGESLCYCRRELRRGHHDTCWVLKAHEIAHTTPSGEMDG